MKKPAIKPIVKDHIQRRKMWRTRLFASATNMLATPGCNSDDYKAAVSKAAAKVVLWGGGYAAKKLFWPSSAASYGGQVNERT